MELTEKEKENFTKLVRCAEAYVRKKANIIRLLNDNTDIVKVIKDKYQPKAFMKAKNNDERLNLALERFCIELQNYRGMTTAIDYGSFGNDYKNEIFKFVKEEYEKTPTSAVAIYQGLHEVCGFDEEKKLSKALEKKLSDKSKNLKGEKVNSAWLRYSIGLKNVIDFLHDNGLKRLYQYFEIGKKLNLRIFKDIYYMGEALTYDFFKELGRTDLIKPDTHIKAILKEIFPNENYNDKETVVKMLELIEEYNKGKNEKDKCTPYNIDKLLWLCCTGTFYEDGIKILSMNQQDFLKFYEEKTGKGE